MSSISRKRIIILALFVVSMVIGYLALPRQTASGVLPYDYDEAKATTIQKWQHVSYVRHTGKAVKFSDLVSKFGEPAELIIGEVDSVATFSVPAEETSEPQLVHVVHVVFRDDTVSSIGFNSESNQSIKPPE